MSFGQSFLAEPDLFPARPAGAPWGDVEATIAFAGRRYRVYGMSSGQLARIAERFGPMIGADVRSERRVGSAHRPDGAQSAPYDALGRVAGDIGDDDHAVPLLVFRAPREEFLHDKPPLWEVTFDLDPQPQAVRVAGQRFVARLDWRPSLVAALWTCVGDDPELPMVFENFFRLAAAYDLAGSSGALLHSAAVEVDGGAVVLFGPSGAGKTTVAERALEAGLRVLSDDLNAVVVSAAGARVEKVPFAGTHGGGPEPLPPLPLRALGRLRQAATVEATPMSAGAALAALFAAAPFVNADPYRGPALEASLLALLQATPVVELGFARDSTFAEIMRVLRA